MVNRLRFARLRTPLNGMHQPPFTARAGPGTWNDHFARLSHRRFNSIRSGSWTCPILRTRVFYATKTTI